MSYRIGFDIDDCAYQFVPSFRDWLMVEHDLVDIGVDPIEQYPEPQEWDFYKTWGFTDEYFVESMVKSVNSGKLYWKGDVYPGCVETVSELYREGYEIVFITSRDYPGIKIDPIKITEYWLSSKGIPFHEVIVSHDKCSDDHGLDLLVDDSPKHIKARLDCGKPIVAFNQAWNRDIEKVDRVYDWNEVFKYVHEKLPIGVAKRQMV